MADATVIPLHLVRNAVQQSERMGIDEPRAEVIHRVLQDLRDPLHPQHTAATVPPS
jgi:hypothetical protein